MQLKGWKIEKEKENILKVIWEFESFGWILLNSEFICIIVTVQSYLENWGKRVNFGNGVAEIQQKYEREREKAGERKFWISAMVSPKFLLPKPTDRETNCGNTIVENRRKKNSSCRNHMWGIKKKKKCYIYNSFTTFLHY